jgi:hypothetical protein
VAVLGLAGVLMLAVFPARALLAQHTERGQVAARIRVLDQQNRSLEARTEALKTDAEIERLARQHYDLVRPGEEVFDIVAPPAPAAASSSGPAPTPQRASAAGSGPLHRVLNTLTDVF